jgi:dTDP-L-rhamnose 4-epimerase
LSIANTLRQYLGEAQIAVSGQFRAGDIRHNVADLSKVSRVLGFKPGVSFDEGLHRFVDWVRGERVEGDRYEESLSELRAKDLFK